MARQEGARYVEYTHPNAGAQGEHTVRVSLYPQEDLGVGAIKAFHGSPYDFDRFDMSKIGTGEGAQAYGHGLYFAESEPVAWTYRYLNAPVGQGTGAASFARQAESAASNAGLTGDEARTYAIDLLNKKAMEQHPTARQTWYDAANNYDALIGAKEPPGRMYEARINADPEHFLDWDKPLSQQSEKVQEALRNEPFASLIKANMDKGTQTRAQYGLPGSGEMMPENLYNILRGYVNAGGSSLNIPGGDMASRSLREAGIPGIRYLDQGSRGAGEGTHNYVVFDDKLIDIIKKYGLAGLVAGGAATIGGGTAGATHLIPVEHDPFDTASLGPSGTGRPLPPPQMPAVPEDKGRPRQDRDHDYKPTQFGSMFDILQAAGVR
jgi:hypothetical protein